MCSGVCHLTYTNTGWRIYIQYVNTSRREAEDSHMRQLSYRQPPSVCQLSCCAPVFSYITCTHPSVGWVCVCVCVCVNLAVSLSVSVCLPHGPQSVCAAQRSVRSGGQCVCVSLMSHGAASLTSASPCVSENKHTHTNPTTVQQMNRGTLKKVGFRVWHRLIFSPVCLSISWQLPCWIMTADSDSVWPVRLQTSGSDQCLISGSSAKCGGVNERCK